MKKVEKATIFLLRSVGSEAARKLGIMELQSRKSLGKGLWPGGAGFQPEHLGAAFDKKLYFAKNWRSDSNWGYLRAEFPSRN